MWVRGCPIKSACLTLQTSRNPGSSSGGGPWWLRAATKVLPPRQPRAGPRRPPPGEYKSKKISKECWTRQSLSFQICGCRHNWVLLKGMRNMHFFLGNGILSMPFHCHGFTGQRDSFNAFSLSRLCRAVGFFQCLFIVMVSQGNGILSMSFHCHGFTGQWSSFKVRHCHGFTRQWDSEGSGILYFNVFSLLWFHRAMGF